ncbi:MAG: type II toxin-antitoxin system RelE/ParE family toxin [Patescibacteria group bacterium]
MFEVLLTREAEKQLESIDKRYQKAIAAVLLRLGQNPNIGKSLSYDLKGSFRIRVAKYRIVYEINHAKGEILVLMIEHRKDVYR